MLSPILPKMKISLLSLKMRFRNNTENGQDIMHHIPAFKAPSTKMLISFLFTMHATPFFYNGDEIGMSNIRFDRISDYRDIESINMYKQIKRKKGDVKRFLENQKESARDNSRTPFQWDRSPNAGFTDGTPWLKVNPNYTEYNVEAQ